MAPASDRPLAREPLAAEEWARRLQNGDPQAFQTVRERVRRILSYQRIRIPVRDREDLEQDVMTEVWRAVNRSDFDFAAGFWGFVEVVTSRRCIDWLRGRRAGVPIAEQMVDRSASAVENMLASERLEVVSEVLDELDPTCRQVMLLRFHEGKSYRDISRMLGKSEGALRVQFYRCVRRAQELLEERGFTVGANVPRGGSHGPH